jgi:hypothetical protein
VGLKKAFLSVIENPFFSDILVVRWTAFVRWGDLFELFLKRPRGRKARVLFGDPALASRQGYYMTFPKSEFVKCFLMKTKANE